MRGFGYYILFAACQNKGNHYETTSRGPAWKPAKADVASSLNIVIYF